jgi:hypothetical protein
LGESAFAKASAVAKAMADRMARLAAVRSSGEGAQKHVFLRNEPTDFTLENRGYQSRHNGVMAEIIERKRWVRFGKRTHREAYFGGVRLPRQLLRGISSDSVWEAKANCGGNYIRVAADSSPIKVRCVARGRFASVPTGRSQINHEDFLCRQ